MDTFECEKQYFESDSTIYGQPVKLLKNRGDVLSGGCASCDLGCRILKNL